MDYILTCREAAERKAHLMFHWGEWDNAKGSNYIISKTQQAWNEVFSGQVQ